MRDEKHMGVGQEREPSESVARASRSGDGASVPVVRSWPARIAAARKNGRFTDRDNDLASNWPTCACGNLDADIPRGTQFSNDAPADAELHDLGMQFYHSVKGNEFSRAADLIKRITQRAAEVLAEQRLHRRADAGAAETNLPTPSARRGKNSQVTTTRNRRNASVPKAQP
jgi:hypothetical protein